MLSRQLAEALLKAWLSADPVDVDAQLELSCSIALDVDDSNEQERRQLLRSVAVRMRHTPDLIEDGRPTAQLELYIHLLGHMVS